MKSVILLLLSIIVLGQSQAQQDRQQILFGLGVRGVTGDQSVPFGYTFTSGVKNERVGFLSTLSYAESDVIPIIRIAGFSTQLLFRLTHNTMLSAGPEIHITLLGLMKLGVIGELHYQYSEDIMPYVGYSDVGRLTLGVIVAL